MSHPVILNNYIFFLLHEDLMVTHLMVFNIACQVSSKGMDMERFFLQLKHQGIKKPILSSLEKTNRVALVIQKDNSDILEV